MTKKTKSAIIGMIQSRSKATGSEWIHVSWLRGYITERSYFKADAADGVTFDEILGQMIVDKQIESDGKRVRIDVQDGLDDLLDVMSKSLSFDQLKAINNMANGMEKLPDSGRALAEIVLRFYRTKPAPVTPTERSGKVYASKLEAGTSRTYSLADKKRVKNSYHVLASTAGRRFTFLEDSDSRTITVTRLS